MTDFDTFLDTHGACQPGRARLAAAGITTFREAYDRAAPQDLIWGITRPGVMTQRDCVRFALHCVESVADQLTDERSRAVIPLLHRWLDDPSTVTRDELAAADSAASAAADAYAAARAAWAARNAWDAYVAVSSAARDDPGAWIRENIPFEALHTN